MARVRYSDIDWSKVAFPSDRLALGELRWTGNSDPDTVGLLAHNLIILELDVARYELLPDPSLTPDGNKIRRKLRDGQAEELAELYVEMGVATGKREAQLLVKQFREAVAAMGSQSKRGRG